MDAVFPIIIAKMIKVLIADDQELIRESLKIILGAHDNIEIVGVVGNGYEVLETLKKHKVDIILMDIRISDNYFHKKPLKMLHFHPI